MIYGYARVSTQKQDLAYQLDRLQKAGCERIIHEKKSGKDTQGRPEFLRLLASLEPGDTLLATVSDRIARDPLDMLLILREIQCVGARLKLLDQALDSVSGEADLNLFLHGWAGKQYRLRLLENTKNGRAIAKARGGEIRAQAEADAASKGADYGEESQGRILSTDCTGVWRQREHDCTGTNGLMVFFHLPL
jgi:DNA invertase Pin-like site-specific DNA recombinase